MPVPRADFESANRVVFRARIHQVSLNRNSGVEADFIDLNKDGYANSNWQSTGWTTASDIYTEPALGVPLQRILEHAAALEQGEILTSDDVANIPTEDLRVNFGTTVFTPTVVQRSNHRALGALVPLLAPLGKDNGCGIDTTSQEFIIYTPLKK